MMSSSSDNDEEEEEVPQLIEHIPSEEILLNSRRDYSNIIDEQDSSNNNNNNVPVTILSGFLGAGKSTLVRYILTSPDHGKRIAVIENEFAGLTSDQDESVERESLSVETLIVQDIDSGSKSKITDLIELPNGCICCTVKDNLVEALETLLEKKGADIDYILIEASGMANPGPIASVFWLDDALESRLRLDGIVTMVDTKNILMQLKETKFDGSEKGGGEAEQQIAFADRIIINKKDLADNVQLNNVISTIHSINPTAPRQIASFANISNIDWVLNTHSFDINRLKESMFGQVCEDIDGGQKWNNPGNLQNYLPSSRCSNVACKSCEEFSNNELLLCGFCGDKNDQVDTRPIVASRLDHSHTGSIRTVVLVCDGSVSLRKVNSGLSTILWPNQDDQENIKNVYATIFRIKGVLSTFNDGVSVSDDSESNFIGLDGLDSRRYIVQAVNDLWEIHPANTNLCWAVNDKRFCKIVLIGRHLNYEQLLHGFSDCFL